MEKNFMNYESPEMEVLNVETESLCFSISLGDGNEGGDAGGSGGGFEWETML